jgi:hypothetical protein
MDALTMDVVRGVPGTEVSQVALLDMRHKPRAGDQWLRLFRQGGLADTAAGSAWLAQQAQAVSRPEVLARATSDEVLGVGRAWKALEAWTFARKLAVVRELVRRHPKDDRYDPDTACGLPGEWEPSLHHEIAAALGISPIAAGKLTRLAWTLDTRLRGTGQALEDGRLDPARVKLIADETSVLEDEALYPRAEAIILADLPGCTTWGALQRLVQRAVITVDTEGATRRREQAEREHARVRFWRENSGTCAMQATGLPTDEALAANASIEARARAYKAARITRPMDILRVMAYLDLLNGVTVAQRAAWAEADDQARAAEEAERQARGDAAGGVGRDPGADDGPDAGGPSGDARDGDGPGGPDRGGPASAGGGAPGGGAPGGPGSGPHHGHPDDALPDGGSPGGPAGGYPSDWPADDDGPGDDGLDDGPPEGPSGGHGSSDLAAPPCPQCGGRGDGTGLPVRASLTIPAGALNWLAGQPASNTGTSTRGRARSGAGAGGGGPGQRHHGGPGPCPVCGGQGSASLPARQHLVLPLLTLAGLADRSGEAHGLGALDPALVRDLAATGARHPGSQFCLTVTDEHGFAIGHGCLRPMLGKKGRAVSVDPDRLTITRSGRSGPDSGFGSWVVTLPGALRPFMVDIHPVPTHACDHRLETRTYRPGSRLRHLVQVRDGACSFPACSRQARESDFEHAVPYDRGGRTCACNAHACSRSCHRAKQRPGWRVTKPQPGWTQWTTQAGRTYLQGPWRYPS